ncbi:MAG: hypothetical protein IJ493_05500 [Clostridia bacterium]|nr:hypothetical protein [Clostridia bacterium]
MRSEDRASSKAAGSTNDISANELLALLHKSVETPSGEKKKSGSGTAAGGTTGSAGKKQPSGGLLEIDEDVYQSAQSGLLHADQTAADDSDLDIDALIDKYIRKPEKKKEPELVLPPLEEEPAAEDEIPQFDEIPGRNAAPDNGNISDDLVKEIARTDVYTQRTDEDEDMKVYGAPETAKPKPAVEWEPINEREPFIEPEPVAELPEAQPAEPAQTAVFDITKVREAAEGRDETVDEAIDNAFAEAQTSVFTPVHEEQTEQKVYGEPGGEEIDQTDLNLMIAFGMNEELKETVGEEKASEMEDNIQKKHEETVEMQSTAQMYEYTDRSQNTEILTQYKSRYYTLILRIALAVVLGLASFVLENYSLFGLTLPSFMRPESYPVVYAMIDLQFVVLAGALVYRQVLEGAKNMVTLRPTPESLTAFLLILSAVYTVASCMAAPREGFALYNLPVMVGVVLALLYEFMNLKRDVFSFNVISSQRKKFVVSPVSDATESLERESFHDYIPDDSQIIRVGRTDFVDGFFHRVNDNSISKPIIGITIPLVMILACGFFILTYIKTTSLYEAFTMAYLTIAITMPLATFVIYSCPFYKAAKDAYDCESAIIGETSLHEYAGSSVISFEDKEVFPSGGVKVTSIKVYGSNRIDQIIYNLASAFIKVGGPLADVFSQATHDLGHSEAVELVEVDDDGFTVTIDDVQVYIGKTSYMEKKDYEPPFDAEDKRIEQNTSIGILYVAYAGQLAAKVYVQYTIDNEFEQILAQLYKTGMCVGIKSFDPNIDDLLLAKKIKAMKYPVKVIRSKTVEDIPHTFDRCDSGIVSKRSVKELLKTVAICEKVSGVIKTNLIVKVLAMLIGVIVMICLYSFGQEMAVTSLLVTLYQLFWVIPVFLISWFMV